MNKNNNEATVVIKPVNQPYITIDKNIHSTLTLSSLSLYMTLRYEADFAQEDAEVKRSAKYLYTKAKIKKSQYYLSMNELEKNGLVLRDPGNKLGDKCVFHVARELGYFTKGVSDRDRGVHTVDRGVHTVDTDQYSFPLLNTTTSSSSNSKSETPVNSAKAASNELMRGMIDAYREIFPDNPQPHAKLISTSLQKTLQTLIKRWPEADPDGKPFDIVGFKRYLHGLKTLAPKFSLGEYETKDGNKKKNGMETFCRWNTFVKFLEDQYS